MNTATGYGYYNPQLIPEPDSPLTADWAVAVVSGIKRLFCFSTHYGTFVGGSSPLIFTFNGASTYTKSPFVKIYAHSGSGASRRYSDFVTQGSNSVAPFYVNLSFVDKLSPVLADKATVYFSGTIPGSDGFTILAHGR